jgi:hypothetical protein
LPEKRKRINIPDTINDLLARDGINAMLEKIDKEKANIKDALFITLDKDGWLWWETTEGTSASHAVWMALAVITDLMSPQEDKGEKENDS